MGSKSTDTYYFTKHLFQLKILYSFTHAHTHTHTHTLLSHGLKSSQSREFELHWSVETTK